MNADDARAVYRAKAAAELDDAEQLAGAPVRGWRGAPVSKLAFVISALSASGGDVGEPLRGEIGDAADKVAVALGVLADDYFVVVSRSSRDLEESVQSRRLTMAIEAADPRVVIALDDGAALDISRAFGAGPLQQGVPVRIRGRVIGAAGDLGASLIDAKAKARVWAAMKAISAEAGMWPRRATGRSV